MCFAIQDIDTAGGGAYPQTVFVDFCNAANKITLKGVGVVFLLTKNDEFTCTRTKQCQPVVGANPNTFAAIQSDAVDARIGDGKRISRIWLVVDCSMFFQVDHT